MLEADQGTLNVQMGRFLMEAFCRLGVSHVVLSPGSRSTPLVVGATSVAGLELVSSVDERSASFFALGLVRRLGRPVILLCTSGSAPGHYLPALLEAREAHLPLIVISADRPPELQGVHAGQTTCQQELFGKAVGAFYEWAPVEPTKRFFYSLKERLGQVWAQVLNASLPVHINIPVREPMLPQEIGAVALPDELEALLSTLAPEAARGPLSLARPLRLKGRGLIIAGMVSDGAREESLSAYWDFFSQMGLPVLADIVGGWRFPGEKETEGMIAHYDLILRTEEFADSLAPDFIISIGQLPTSKVLRQWIAGLNIPWYIVSPDGDSYTAGLRQASILKIRAAGLSSSFELEGRDEAYMQAWKRCDLQAAQKVDEGLGLCPEFGEGLLASRLLSLLPEDSLLYLASSMPIRDFEWYASCESKKCQVFANRGVNGIDGTLSTAMGVAHGAARPLTLVTGDLAFLHDLNALWAHQPFEGRLRIILLNNQGGGIFKHLPISQWRGIFEPYFETPRSVDFASIAKAFGIPFRQTDQFSELEGFLKESIKPGIEWIEFSVDADQAHAARQKLNVSS